MDRLSQFLGDPWRLATTVLALALLVSVALLATGGGGAAPPGTTTPDGTTTVGPGPDVSTTTSTLPPGSGFKGMLAVKIDNAPPARPQVGIGSVPLLLEYPVEGGLTRFIAVVDTNATGTLGPVRSLRPVDGDLFPLLAPAVASTGGQPFVIREVEAGGTTRVEPGTQPVFSFADRPAPYNVFLDVGPALGLAGDFNPADPPIPGGSLPLGATIGRLSITTWGVDFVWEAGSWRRHHQGVPFLVSPDLGGSPEPLTHDVVVILQVGQRSAGYTDSNGAPVFTFDVIGAGDMVVLHEGQAVTGTWLRRSHAEAYRLFGPGGEPVGVPDGRLYVAFVPQGTAVEME